MKALLVDDDLDHVDLMTFALRREGYTVVAAIDGRQALDRLQADHPDIILLDVNGLEGCQVPVYPEPSVTRMATFDGRSPIAHRIHSESEERRQRLSREPIPWPNVDH